MGRKLRMIKLVIIYGFLVLALLTYVFPIFWATLSSFKTPKQAEVAATPIFIFKPTLKNYQEVLRGEFPRYLLNSLIIATINVLLCLILGVPAGYALARHRFKGGNNLAFWILSIRMAPAFGFIVPFYLIFRDLRLLDTHLSLVLLYLLPNLPFTIWMIRGFVQDLPKEIEESAMIDGCSRMGALQKIVFPLIKPGIAATAILAFIFSWNEFLFAYIITRTSARTVPVAIASYVGYMGIEWTKMCACATISSIPIIIFFLLVQKHVVRGLTLGALGKY